MGEKSSFFDNVISLFVIEVKMSILVFSCLSASVTMSLCNFLKSVLLLNFKHFINNIDSSHVLEGADVVVSDLN